MSFTTAGSFPVQLFDASAPVTIVERKLPHWSQAGVACFITFRTHDSIPQTVLAQWRAERCAWLRSRGIDPGDAAWRERLASLGESSQIEFYRRFSQRWHDHLDTCHGECVLRKVEISAIVARSLHHGDGDRYEILDFVIMPNHVHLVAVFINDTSMLSQCESWKHFTATAINRQLSRRGRLWQQDGFDHLVRSVEQLTLLRQYIAENPRYARLRPGQFVHYSKSIA